MRLTGSPVTPSQRILPGPIPNCTKISKGVGPSSKCPAERDTRAPGQTTGPSYHWPHHPRGGASETVIVPKRPNPAEPARLPHAQSPGQVPSHRRALARVSASTAPFLHTGMRPSLNQRDPGPPSILKIEEQSNNQQTTGGRHCLLP